MKLIPCIFNTPINYKPIFEEKVYFYIGQHTQIEFDLLKYKSKRKGIEFDIINKKFLRKKLWFSVYVLSDEYQENLQLKKKIRKVVLK